MPSKAPKALDSPLLEAVREHHARATRSRQEYLIGRLKGLVEFWNETFIREPDLRKPEHRHWPVVWPTKDDLIEFDEIVNGLVGTIRKKPMSPVDAVSTVAAMWPRLKLRTFVENFFRRATQQWEIDGPEPSAEASHFLKIIELANGKGGKSQLAKKFLSIHDQFTAKGKKLPDVKWPRFRELLADEQGRICLKDPLLAVAQDSDAECYIKYLELSCGLLLWRQEVRKWYGLQEKDHVPFCEWMEKIDKSGTVFSDAAAETKKANARNRKQRQRHREKAEKFGVTAPPSGSLKDLLLPG